MPDDIVLTKDQLRLESKRIRASMTADECRQASEAICLYIESWECFQAAGTVLTYLPMRNEVDLTALFSRCRQKKWVIPRIRSEGQMTFHTYDPSKLVRHAFGMLEPDPDSPVTSPRDIQLALVPGLIFDSAGWRLGYGGGYYDRFLSGYEGISAGITYRRLLVEKVPHGLKDIPVQFVITETGIITVS